MSDTNMTGNGASGNQADTNKAKYGSSPSGPIPDGGKGEAKQPKERTGNDTNMGGSGGGTRGNGHEKK